MERLLAACFDFTLGTVWTVREDLWRETFRGEGQPYDQNGKRKWHPGVSLRQVPPVSPYEYIPMLHGSSGDHGPVVVRGLTKEHDPEYPTSFGSNLRPTKIQVLEATRPASDADPDQGVGPLWKRSRVAVNVDKPRLDTQEMESLRGYLRNKNLL